jgi:branched-chain amino acid transport system permease protein
MGALIAQLAFDGLSMGLIYVMLALGMTLIMSAARVLLLAYGMFYTIGAFAVWWAATIMGWPFYVALIAGVLVALVFGLASYFLIFHRLLNSGRDFLVTLIASMGLQMLLSQAVLVTFGPVARGVAPVFPGRLMLGGVSMSWDKVAMIAFGIVATLALFWVYEKTKIGRAIKAVSFHKETAALCGVKPTFVFVLVFGLATALAGFTGGILAPSFGVSPDMGNTILWTLFLLMMLGGMESLLGAAVAGFIVGQILSFGQYYIGPSVQIILFLVIGIIIYFKPNGLMGKRQRMDL